MQGARLQGCNASLTIKHSQAASLQQSLQVKDFRSNDSEEINGWRGFLQVHTVYSLQTKKGASFSNCCLFEYGANGHAKTFCMTRPIRVFLYTRSMGQKPMALSSVPGMRTVGHAPQRPPLLEIKPWPHV
eukprot:1151036-Pelagomonas_calceolata.AAC.3